MGSAECSPGTSRAGKSEERFARVRGSRGVGRADSERLGKAISKSESGEGSHGARGWGESTEGGEGDQQSGYSCGEIDSLKYGYRCKKHNAYFQGEPPMSVYRNLSC